MQVGPDDTLAHVASELMRLDVAQLPVLHYPAHALVPELLHLACLSGILRCRSFTTVVDMCSCTVLLITSKVSGMFETDIQFIIFS